MASELRKTALNAEDIEKEIVDVPEWGINVEVRGMAAADRFRLLQTSSVEGKVNFQRWFPDLVIACVYDPDSGERVFEPADRDALLAKSGKVVGSLAETASRLSGLSDADVEAAKTTFQE